MRRVRFGIKSGYEIGRWSWAGVTQAAFQAADHSIPMPVIRRSAIMRANDKLPRLSAAHRAIGLFPVYRRLLRQHRSRWSRPRFRCIQQIQI